MTEPRITRIALFGPSGAGKSTTGRLISVGCAALGIGHHRLALAEPLYQAQAQIYRIARRPLEDPRAQDGELLTFLGRHMRRINPTVLTDDFAERLQNLTSTMEFHSGTRHLIVCDDMRYPDWEDLDRLGFLPVQVYAAEQDCYARRRARGDMNVVSGTPWTEQGLDKIPTARTLTNSGSLDDLAAAVARLLEELFA